MKFGNLNNNAKSFLMVLLLLVGIQSLSISQTTLNDLRDDGTDYPKSFVIGVDTFDVITRWQHGMIIKFLEERLLLINEIQNYYVKDTANDAIMNMLRTTTSSQQNTIEILSRLNETTASKSLDYYDRNTTSLGTLAGSVVDADHFKKQRNRWIMRFVYAVVLGIAGVVVSLKV